MNRLIIDNNNSLEVIEEERMVELEESVSGFGVKGGMNSVALRENGEFGGRALFLSSSYEWKLGVDSGGSTVLVPLKKV